MAKDENGQEMTILLHYFLNALQLLIVSHQAQMSWHTSPKRVVLYESPNIAHGVSVRSGRHLPIKKVYSTPKPAFHSR